MITTDPYGINKAVRPWESLDAKKPVRSRRVNQAEIDMCLGCELDQAECYGKCSRLEKKRKKKVNPCLKCYSAEVCQKVGGTCNEKERYKSESAI